MKKLILYHGSSGIVEKPELKKGKTYNDYGQGFYCTQHIELAKEWACSENVDGYVNAYEIDMTDLKILNLSSDEYTVLHWLAVLVEYRRFRITSSVMRRGAEWLREHFMPDLEPYDIIIGYRADDSYFSFAKAFLRNEISLDQLSYAIRLGDLGEQIVLKSENAFDRINFLFSELADNEEYYIKRKVRNESAQAAYLKEIEKEDLEGIYIRDLIRGEVQYDDPRLR